MAEFVPLPKQLHEFQIELDQHPDLQIAISGCIAFEEKIASLALALNLILDGHYHSWEITNILEELTRRMRKRREIVVIEDTNGKALSFSNTKDSKPN